MTPPAPDLASAAALDALLQPGDALPAAFDRRQALMPMWGARPVSPEERDARWPRVAATPLADQTLAYLHIPFCTSRCVFCGFYRNAWQKDAGAGYVDRLIAELAHEAALRPAGGSVTAVYFGGGTPTALSAADLGRLLRAVREHLPLSDDCEITIEGRISHFTGDKIEACLEAGANRFSIGIQTFDSTLRRRLGRQHGGEEAADYLRHLRQYDAVLVADLIFGLPSQDDACWMRDISIASDLGLDGLDVYAFNCYPSLPINRLIEKGTLPPPQDLPTQARHYAWAVRRLRDAGWQQLSNSHFGAASGRERNRYNSQVKSGLDCLAFGSGAGGQRGGLSYQVNGELEAYLSTPASQKPFGFVSATSPNKALFGAIQGQLETGRLDNALLAGNAEAEALLQAWHADGLLTRGATEAQLSIGGRFWAPTMIRALALTLEPYPDAMTARPAGMPHGHPGGARPGHPGAMPPGHPASAPHGAGGRPIHTLHGEHPHAARKPD
ncbi:MAG: heme anaerobic degradation radical SAM methyltransferase ChuW/HutW [Candidatus Dactylopiibacterium sp.]|nr:heme anaerobic degradation radical SAM methyltransferase ChuW/HutW [Candidatus Dactylopiibacterium sp.]